MKRLLKLAVKPFWRLTAPIRRPIVRKFDAKINYMIATSIKTELLPSVRESLGASARTLERLDGSIAAANRTANTLASDMDLMLGSVIREVARLQAQVEDLEDAIARLASPGRAGLSLVEADDDAPFAHAERSRVG